MMEMEFQIFMAGFEAGEKSMRDRAIGHLMRPPPVILGLYESWVEYQRNKPRLEIAEPGAKRPEAPAEGSP